jgi:hypothetical protein
MTRKYVTYTHEIAPGLLLTVETEERGTYEGLQFLVDDQLLEGATLSAFGQEINLLEGRPWDRDPLCWLDSDHPEKARLVDLALVKGKRLEKSMERAAA